MANNQQKFSFPSSDKLLIDFFSFKFMILEVISPALFIMALVALLFASFTLMRNSFGLGLFVLIVGFVGVRIFFELIMVGFAILATLREIRDKLPEKNNVTLKVISNNPPENNNDTLREMPANPPENNNNDAQ